MAGDKVGAYHYEMNTADLEANLLRSQRQGIRRLRDVHDALASEPTRYQAYSQDHYPPDFLIDLAHKLVDNGMDMYVGHGNHTIAGIEIYKGRPIFYNLGNFSVCGSVARTPRPLATA